MSSKKDNIRQNNSSYRSFQYDPLSLQMDKEYAEDHDPESPFYHINSIDMNLYKLNNPIFRHKGIADSPYNAIYHINDITDTSPLPDGWNYIDLWLPEESDNLVTSRKGFLYIDLNKLFNIGLEDDNKIVNLNSFILTSKRCYNGKEMILHLPHYLNYFEKFYDTERELLSGYLKIKISMDRFEEYTKEMFMNDLFMYIITPSIMNKVHALNEDNYILDLDSKKYKNVKNPSLTYKDRHSKLLMWISLLQNMCIPLITHYIYIHKMITNANDFLLEIYDKIIHLNKDIDIYNKLYETCLSNVNQSFHREKVLWEMQPIRGKSPTTQTLTSVNNILLNIAPKYTYYRNNILFNYVSIKQSNGFQVENIGYEYDFVSLSNAKRDAENNSVFDKFEAYMIKSDDLLYLINKTAAEESMRKIDLLYGPFDEDEIDIYIKRLSDDEGNIVNQFQKKLVFLLFHKYFGDPITTSNINKRDYIKLIIAGSRMLKANNTILMPYILSSKIEKIVERKSINKKELEKLQSSQLYELAMNKYMDNDDKTKNEILSIIATILSSEFRIIAPKEPDADGMIIDKTTIGEYLGEEILTYINLI